MTNIFEDGTDRIVNDREKAEDAEFWRAIRSAKTVDEMLDILFEEQPV